MTSTTTDPTTTEGIWREFGTQLQAFVHRRVSDPQRADDVLGTIALHIHTNVGRVENRDRLVGWVYRIARNAIVDEYRRAARERVRIEPLAGDAPPEAGTDWGEDQPSALTELAACMRPLLGGLSPEQRSALEWTESTA